MAELSTIARPYAKAAFQAALSADQLADWSAMLAFASQVAQDVTMKDVLDNPSLTNEQKANAFADVCEGKLSEQGQNLVRVLAENKRLTLIPQISSLFEQLKALQEQSVDVSIESAFDLSSDQEKALAKALSTKLARKVNISSSVNRTLLGGAVIRAGDLVIDASVRGKLAKLAEAIGS
ncbi:MAG: F0F1 ATP synthase subunit delta [Pseudomonadales bacterium]|uniref:ATP synthase subunit delta n=1 Tax=Oleiphilus messinensis TaxID=141451 RepID=A0A1Y0IHM3_9GAMM|nr:F0F1 ATP synthase subunit delta [Oleiphilus messinensis]ARU59599.1 F0F1 ATP synthase subunit delta [Oleiphilus messinensis]MCG8612092.1 F0F1 ATP synthase subunit delta [Pseudomonadales bacterium]